VVVRTHAPRALHLTSLVWSLRAQAEALQAASDGGEFVHLAIVIAPTEPGAAEEIETALARAGLAVESVYDDKGDDNGDSDDTGDNQAGNDIDRVRLVRLSADWYRRANTSAPRCTAEELGKLRRSDRRSDADVAKFCEYAKGQRFCALCWGACYEGERRTRRTQSHTTANQTHSVFPSHNDHGDDAKRYGNFAHYAATDVALRVALHARSKPTHVLVTNADNAYAPDFLRAALPLARAAAIATGAVGTAGATAVGAAAGMPGEHEHEGGVDVVATDFSTVALGGLARVVVAKWQTGRLDLGSVVARVRFPLPAPCSTQI
jgi:hypothetical protein